MKHKISKPTKRQMIFLAHMSIFVVLIIVGILNDIFDFQDTVSPMLFVSIWFVGIIILDARLIINKLDNDYKFTNHEEYQQTQEIERMLEESDEPEPVDPYACPNCGGTSFTPVRRKWSMWNGYRTNKIDMVCNRCGYVKKG